MDREHDAVAKAVVTSAVFSGYYQSRFGERFSLIVDECRLEVLPAAGRITKAIPCGNFTSQAAISEVGDSLFRTFQLCFIELSSRMHDIEQIYVSPSLVSALRFGRILLRDHHANAGRQVVDRINKSHAL